MLVHFSPLSSDSVLLLLLLLLFEGLIFKFAFPCDGHFLPIAFLLKGKSFFEPFLAFKLLIMDAKKKPW